MTSTPVQRQPNVAGGRTQEVRVRLTEAEYADLLARATAEKVTVARFLVETAMGTSQPSVRAMLFELLAFRALIQSIVDSMYVLARDGEDKGYDVFAHDLAVTQAAVAIQALNQVLLRLQ